MVADAATLEEGLRSGKIGGVGMDVYENEQSYFFRDCSDQVQFSIKNNYFAEM